MQEINGVNLPFMPVGGVKELKRESPGTTGRSGASFDEIFKKELNEVKFSSHAQSRMISRDMELSPEEIEKVNSAVQKAEEKGAIESLVMLKDKALIVSIPNKTVITIMGNEQMQQNVITNIDSAIFAG